jgi:hypothetical protein
MKPSLRECQDVVRAARLAVVAAARKLFEQRTVIFLGVHFADNARTFFLQ